MIKRKCAQTLATETAKVLVREVFKTAVGGPESSIMTWDMVYKMLQVSGVLEKHGSS